MPKQTRAQQTGVEIRQLRACINDLIGLLALPAIWKGTAPSEIVRTLLDMLLSTLNLDFAYLRLKDSVREPPFEVLRVAHSHAVTVQSEEIGDLLKGWPEGHLQKLPQLVQNPFGDGELSIVRMPLGLGGEIGVLVAGSRRADFPAQTERLLLSVAANQATIGLQEAWLLSEQKRVADELDRRVAQQTEELAAANKELENRERRIRRLVDANILGIFIWDLEGAIVEANEAFLHMLRYGREDVASGRVRWTDLTPPEWRERDGRALADLKATGTVQPYEKEYFRKDGSRVPVLVAGALFDEGGGEGVAFALDLNKQKRAEEALRSSEAYLMEAQRATHTGSCALDGTGREILYWSDEMFRLFGFDPEQGLPTWNQWVQRIHPEDSDKFRIAGDRTFLEKIPCDAEFRVVMPDGTVKHIHGIGHPVLSPSGELVQVIGTMVDITERTRAEEERERLREAQRVVVETASDAVVSADESGVIQFANPATTRVFGYYPRELIGKPLTVLMPEFMRSLHERGFKRYLATGQRHINWRGTELTGLHRNGQEFPVEVSFGELTMNGQRVFTGFIRDITERKQAEEERERLRRVQADLAHVTRVSTMGELTASLAHEIKQPIGAAVTNAEACLRLIDRDEPDLPEAREAAVEMIKDARRAADIIDRVRSLCQKGSSQLQTVDLNQVIEQMVIMMGDEANRHAVTIRTDLAPGLPNVMADRVQLQQALMNIMLNGIDAMQGTGGELSIKSQLSPDGQLLISVSDTGIGVPAENLEKIFDAFFTTKTRGTGLGLAITRSVIQSHRGHIWATPNSGGGATFQFTLPQTKTAQA